MATLQQYYNTAGLIVANTNYGYLACAGATQTCLYLLTAHLAAIGALIATGSDAGITVGATIDKISVQLQQVPLKNEWQYWLSETPYGKQLYAILQAQSVGGFYQRGSLGRSGFFAAFPNSLLGGRC